MKKIEIEYVDHRDEEDIDEYRLSDQEVAAFMGAITTGKPVMLSDSEETHIIMPHAIRKVVIT